MKKLLPILARLMFALFVAGVVAGVMFYSFNGLGKIFPGDLAGQLFGMALFDIATIVWFCMFIWGCASTMQYVFSMVGFLVGLAGTIGLVSIDVGLSSGMIAAGSMQKELTYIFIAVLVGHLILTYSHHAAAPHIAASISLGVEKAKITDRAEKDAEKYLTDNIAGLSGPIAQELVRQVMTDLNLRPQSGIVLDLPALNVVATPPTAAADGKLGPLDFLKAWFTKNADQPRTYEQAVPMTGPASMPVEEKPAGDDASFQPGEAKK